MPLVSGPRVQSEYSFCSAGIGCTDDARDERVLAPGSERPKCRTLPSSIQAFHGAGDFFDRDVRIDAMLIEQIDDVDPEPFERRFGDFANVFGPAVQPRLLIGFRIDCKAELGRDDDLVANRPRAAFQRRAGWRTVRTPAVSKNVTPRSTASRMILTPSAVSSLRP